MADEKGDAATAATAAATTVATVAATATAATAATAAAATEVAKDTQASKKQKRPPPAELPETYPPKVQQIIICLYICGTGERGREKIVMSDQTAKKNCRHLLLQISTSVIVYTQKHFRSRAHCNPLSFNDTFT